MVKKVKEPESILEEKTAELLKKVDEVVKEVNAPEIVYNVIPQGRVAPMIVRSKEDAKNVPAQFRNVVFDKDGNPLPQWMQVANIFRRSKNKKLAIVGFADTKDQAPYQDPRYEIWGLNDLHRSIPRYDRWFDIHPRDNIEEDRRLMRNMGQPVSEHIGIPGLAKLNVPVYMQDINKDVPNCVLFPLDEMLKFWEKRGIAGARYLTNSIAVMIAFALFEGEVTGNQFECIDIFGVDMAVGSEYVDQRPSCEYWIGIAEGMGVKVYIPPASDLCKTRFMYAFEAVKQHQYNEKIGNMLKNMETRRNQIIAQEQQAHDARMQYEGAIGAVREVTKVWANLDDKL